MTSELHKQLTARGARWLRQKGFGVIASELVTHRPGEQADVIGFRSTCSGLIEVKVSRSDFLADRRKPHRQSGGLGNYRFYLCPPSLILPEDLPERWGLLYAEPRRIVEVVRPPGNVWPVVDSRLLESGSPWAAFAHPSDASAERALLYSIARRLSAGERAS